MIDLILDIALSYWYVWVVLLIASSGFHSDLMNEAKMEILTLETGIRNESL